MAEERIRDWFDQRGLRPRVRAVAQRDTVDDGLTGRYDYTTDTVIVSSGDNQLLKGVHEVAHSSTMWNVVGEPDDAFYDGVDTLREGIDEVVARSKSPGADAVFPETIATEDEALRAGLSVVAPERVVDVLEGGPETSFDEPYTDTEAEYLAERRRVLDDLAEDYEHDIRAVCEPLIDRAVTLAAADDDGAEVVPFFTLLYMGDAIEDGDRVKEGMYSIIESSSEYDDEYLIPALDGAIADYQDMIADDYEPDEAAASVMAGETPSLSDNPYVFDRLDG